LLFLLVLIWSPSTHAKLASFPLDHYVRAADLIVMGRVTGIDDTIHVAVDATLLGKSRATVDVVSYQQGWHEDKPTYAVGERVLLFLRRVRGSGLYDCVHGMGGKVLFVDPHTESYAFRRHETASFTALVKSFIAVRTEPSQKGRLKRLIGLLSSSDVFVITAASNYLNFLVNGQEEEGWLINPPEGTDWSYEAYYERNTRAHKKAWLAWWKKRE
jgi:hypothetical protein